MNESKNEVENIQAPPSDFRESCVHKYNPEKKQFAQSAKGSSVGIASISTCHSDDDVTYGGEWRGLGALCKSQFSRKRLSFRFWDTPEQFVKCRWPIHPCVFLVYRVVFVIIIVGYTILSATALYTPGKESSWKWPIYSSSWYELISSVYSITALVCFLKYYFIPFWKTGRRVEPQRKGRQDSHLRRQSGARSKQLVTRSFATDSDSSTFTEKKNTADNLHQTKMRKLPCILRSYWFLYNANVPFSLPRTLFLSLAGGYMTEFRSDNVKHVELIFCFFLMVELFMSSVPVNILHCWVIALVNLSSASFTIIYWAAGGTGRNGRSYIIKVLDYKDDPGTSALFVAAFIVVVPIAVQLVAFLMTCCRDWMHYKLC